MSGKNKKYAWVRASRPSRHCSGFTLIEVSIVLVIIGLIVGGVLVGRDMIRTAELRADITQVEKLNTAVQTFRLKYNCLPGDCANAQDFFSPFKVSNGNGDGQVVDIDINNGQYSDYFAYVATEQAIFYDHLANAGLVPISDFDVTFSEYKPISQTVITLKSAPSAFILVTCSITAAHRANTCHYARLGVTDSPDGLETAFPPYSTADAYYIDSKTDDGLALTGNIISALNVPVLTEGSMNPSVPAASGVCASSATGNPYALTSSGKLCGLRVKMTF